MKKATSQRSSSLSPESNAGIAVFGTPYVAALKIRCGVSGPVSDWKSGGRVSSPSTTFGCPSAPWQAAHDWA